MVRKKTMRREETGGTASKRSGTIPAAKEKGRAEVQGAQEKFKGDKGQRKFG